MTALCTIVLAVGLTLGCGTPPVPPVVSRVIPVDAAVAPPVGIPRAALAYRGNFIRIWRFYFALSESPAIGAGQIHQESRWNPNARSAWAVGMGQFTPATAAGFAALLPADVRANCSDRAGCPLDPNWAMHALSLYDFQLHRGYAWAATARERWAFVLVGYNGGPGWVPKERATCERSGCDTTRWFGHVEQFCMRSLESCKENRGYPRVILDKWTPMYTQWFGA